MHLRDYARSERIPCLMWVRLLSADGQARAQLVNLSLSGGFLECTTRHPPGKRVELHLPLPGGEPLVVRGAVVRRGRCPKYLSDPAVDHLAVTVDGLGVEFDPLPLDDIQRLSSFLDLLLDR